MDGIKLVWVGNKLISVSTELVEIQSFQLVDCSYHWSGLAGSEFVLVGSELTSVSMEAVWVLLNLQCGTFTYKRMPVKFKPNEFKRC